MAAIEFYELFYKHSETNNGQSRRHGLCQALIYRLRISLFNFLVNVFIAFPPSDESLGLRRAVYCFIRKITARLDHADGLISMLRKCYIIVVPSDQFDFGI